MFVVGCVVLSDAVLGMGVTMDLFGKVNLLRNIVGAGSMRRKDHDRSQDQREQKHDRHDNSCRRCLCGPYIQGSFHALPDFFVVLSPLGG